MKTIFLRMCSKQIFFWNNVEVFSVQKAVENMRLFGSGENVIFSCSRSHLFLSETSLV